jgi:AraC-like DNA-binding protein
MHFTTQSFAPHQRVAAWREAYGRTIAQLELEPVSDGPFKAEATLRALPGLGIVSTETGLLNWRIPASLLDSDDLILVTVETGHWVCNEAGREIRLGPGEAAICLNSETASGTTAGRRTMLRVPLKAIAPMAGNISASLHRPIPANQQAISLLSPYVKMMQNGQAPSGLQRMGVGHVHDLLAVLVGATRDAMEVVEGRGLSAARMRAIKDDVARNLARADLSVAALAMRHRVTPRYIQMLFEGEGTTFTAFVLEARLARAHRMLSDPRLAGAKVIAIALDCGFADLSYFNRAFRRRYGATPSDVRANAARTLQ